MPSDMVVEVDGLGKCYEIYANPRDRLKQLIWPPVQESLARMARRLGGKEWQAACYYRQFWALRDVSFCLHPGESFGIIGRNGSGKSTLLQILAGTLAATCGSVNVRGRVAALLELGSGFNPEFSGRDNVLLNGRILGMTQNEIEERYDRIVAFADIGNFIDQPVKTYSSGMFVRLAFAVQAHIDAQVVIIDEALAVGDVFFRQKCYDRLQQLKDSGAAVLLVSHAMTDIEQYCDRAMFLEQGQIRFIGRATEATKHYYQLHQSDLSNGTLMNGMLSKTEANHENTVPMDGWPVDFRFTSAASLTQIGNGMAQLIRFSVCDIDGFPRQSFVQGQIAVFYFEFLLLQPIAVPLAGLVLQNERGINVHGKGSLEYQATAPHHVAAGTLVRGRQSVELRLDLGEYTFEIGLATIDSHTYEGMGSLSHEQIFSRILRVCHVPGAGVIHVGRRIQTQGPQLTHHGVADLPGSFEFGFDWMTAQDHE